MLKKTLKAVVINISWWLVGAYQRKHKPIVIGVVGSIGKTGTKRAIAKTLSASKRVAWQDGNYNDIVTVPLIYFGLDEPSLLNPFAWIAAFIKMKLQIFSSKGAEVVVLELGTDEPGQILGFHGRLTLDYAVVTAVSYEHMQNFADLQAVADEELAVVSFSDNNYLAYQIFKDGLAKSLDNYKVYGEPNAEHLSVKSRGQDLTIKTSSNTYSFRTQLTGQHQYNALVIAAELGEQLGMKQADLIKGLASVSPMSGRMQLLDGKDGSILIDDTYNSSPDAVRAALDFLYATKTKKRIAVLGNMNEMGKISPKLHQEIGDYCDKAKLDEVITIGPDANQYLAESARKAGCQVKQFDSPVEIGRYLADKDLSSTTVLFKGSQNKVFLEEAIKLVLNNLDDKSKLVRQSSYWLAQKSKQFEGIK
jgi:UDP-N-acetylmuramoyl-tripeptide--D-alanyl-D-alanine ligase